MQKRTIAALTALLAASLQIQAQTNTFPSSGNVGIGTTNPYDKLHLQGTTNGLMFNPDYLGASYIYAFNRNTVLHTPLVLRGKTITFNTASTEPTLPRITILDNGNTGINTTAPTAVLHTNGTLRFQNIPNGTGNILVVDASGNVYKSTSTARVAPPEENPENISHITALNERIDQLEKTITSLQQQLSVLKGGSLDIKIANEKSFLQGNFPNPFSGNTIIKYTYPSAAKKAVIKISDQNGRLLNTIDLKNASANSVTISADQLSLTPGTYNYSLEIDNRIVESKKMTFIR